MSEEPLEPTLSARVRVLAGAFVESGLARLRVEREGETIELGRRHGVPPDPKAGRAAMDGRIETSKAYDAIKADLVGIVRLSRPAPVEGEVLADERTLAIVEALGIRNPVSSRGTGRIVRIACKDGDAVEYGQTLFEIDRE